MMVPKKLSGKYADDFKPSCFFLKNETGGFRFYSGRAFAEFQVLFLKAKNESPEKFAVLSQFLLRHLSWRLSQLCCGS